MSSVQSMCSSMTVLLKGLSADILSCAQSLLRGCRGLRVVGLMTGKCYLKEVSGCSLMAASSGVASSIRVMLVPLHGPQSTAEPSLQVQLTSCSPCTRARCLGLRWGTCSAAS